MARLVFVRRGATYRSTAGDFVVPPSEFASWMTRGGPLRALFSFDDAAIVTPDLCHAGRPFALAVLARLCSRGSVRLIDEMNRDRRVRLQDLARWSRQLLVEPVTRRSFLRRAQRRLDAEYAALSNRTAARVDLAAGCAYFRTDVSFGVRAGGSVGHIAGVINNLNGMGCPPIFVTTDRVPTVDPAIETHLVCASERYWSYRELPAIVMDEEFERVANAALSGRRVGFVYQRYSLNNFAGVRLARRLAVPFVIEYNGSESWVSRHWSGRPLRYESFSSRVEALNFAAANLIVVISDAIRDELIDRAVPAGKILVNPNGVDADRYSPDVDGTHVRARFGFGSETILGFIGTFGAWHGADVLASAYDRLLARRRDLAETTRLLFIGDGATLPAVRATVEQRRARANVVFAGLVPQADGPAYLAACDIFVSPHVPNPDGTRFFGSPTKLFEYMAMGRPIVASDLDQIGQVLEHGESAWLVPPGDENALASGLERVIDDRALQRRLAVRARADAVSRHSWRQHTARIAAALEDVTGGPRVAQPDARVTIGS